MTENEVLERVRRKVGAFNEEGRFTPRLQVPENGIRLDGEWYYVIVQPVAEPRSSYDYYNALSEIEEEIEHDLEPEGVNVLIVPVLPG
jgi:hypothetical protein